MGRQDCTLLDQTEVLRILFYPRPDFRRDSDDDRDVTFPVAEGISIGGRLHIAEKEAPLILLFHGNGEIASDYDGIAPLYTQEGISLLIADYRGYGKSDGSPTASALLDDAMPIFHCLPDIFSERGLDGSKLYIMGRSLGSAAAIEIASQVGDNISGLIIESGFADPFRLIELLSGGLVAPQTEGANGFNNAQKMERVEVPTLLIHGEGDQIIPVANSRTLHDRCGAQQKRLVIVPEAGHNDLLYWGQDLYFGAIREFIFG